MAYKVTSTVNTTVTMRMESSSLRSVILPSIGLRMFSVKVTEGASRVAEAQLLIAESSAPKNITWANERRLVAAPARGRISCGSVSISPATILGSIRVAE